MTNQTGPEHGLAQGLYDIAEEATAKVTERIEAELDKTPELDFLMRQFGAYIYYAAQRLIDLKSRTGQTRWKDEAIILSCPRLFNECFAGYILAKRGLVLQTIVLLRAAFEITTQVILFMEDESFAEKWLQGKRIPPKDVRANSPFAEMQRELYKRLSALSHPNLDAAQHYVVPLLDRSANAAVYGGGFFPKAAGQVSTQFLYAQLVFLEAFYTFYETELEEHDLLWRPGVPESVRNRTSDMTWAEYIAGWRRLVDRLTETYNSMPDDAAEISEYLKAVTG